MDGESTLPTVEATREEGWTPDLQTGCSQPHLSTIERMGISRRDIFRGVWQRGRTAASDLSRAMRTDHSLVVLQRPPGAVAEGQFLASCTRCLDCVAVCPPQAIIVADDTFGPSRSGTPYIDAAMQACVMCTDLPCIEACGPGVLHADLPIAMADVTINEGGCLSWQGERCRLCSEACPVEGAILLDPGDRPRIDPAICTGCGSCLQACPVGTQGVNFAPAQARPFHVLD